MKKKVLLFIYAICLSGHLFAQPVANSLMPKVDKRVELLSIAFRLAGDKDFNDNLNPIYTNTIDKYFKKYINHPFIKYIQKLTDSLNKNNIEWGIWSVEALAVHLSQPPFLEPIIAIADFSNVDGWEDRTLLNTKMVTLLREFYKDAECEVFFKSQQKYYASVEAACEKYVPKLNSNWINNFFGIASSENYYPIICLCMRMGGYTRVNFQNNHRNTYTFFECKHFDSNGIPTGFKDEYFPRMMLHEYIHTFTNQLVDKNLKSLQSAAETMLANPGVASRVKNTFYDNWPFLLYESLVRAAAIKYMKDNTEIKTTAEKEITIQEKAGFFWMKGLVALLDEYGISRSNYKTLEAYMQIIIEYFNSVAKQMQDGSYVLPDEQNQ